MKLLVATRLTPFVRGDGERLAERLVAELETAGHAAEMLRLPEGGGPEEVLDALAAAALLDAVNVDRLIGLTFPGYLVPHSSVVIWMTQHPDELFDRMDGWSAASGSSGSVGAAARRAGRRALSGAERVFAASSAIADHLRAECGVEAPVLVPPSPDDDSAWRRVVGELTR